FLICNIEQTYGSPLIKQVRGLLKMMPWTGGMFAAGLLALMGLPPFGLFISEFALFRAGFAERHHYLMGIVLLLLLIIFVSIISHLNKMLYGSRPEGVVAGETGFRLIAPMMLSIAVLVALGLTLPTQLETLLRQIVGIVSR